MNPELEPILRWMRGTDLAEVVYREAGLAFELRLEGAPPPSERPRIVPVLAAEPGVFRAAAPGRAPSARAGQRVSEGHELGFIEAGKERAALKAPCAGRLLWSLPDGSPAGYGDAVCFLEP